MTCVISFNINFKQDEINTMKMIDVFGCFKIFWKTVKNDLLFCKVM